MVSNQERVITSNLEKLNEDAREMFARSPFTFHHLLFNLGSLDENKLKKLAFEQWDNPDVIAGYEVIFASLASLHQYLEDPQIYRHFLRVSKILGQGAQGSVSAASLSLGEPTVALKNIEENYSQESVLDLTREYIVGSLLSKVAPKTPIFSHAYGLFSCSKVLIKKIGNKKLPLTFCNLDAPATLASQLVPAEHTERLINERAFTEESFLKFLLLLLYGLRDANEELEYTHYDLHPGNVLGRENQSMSVPVEGGYITTDIIPAVIDYGLSRAKTPFGGIFAEGWEGNRIFNKMNPIYDVYKFVMYCLYIMILSDRDLYDRLKWLGTFSIRILVNESLPSTTKATILLSHPVLITKQWMIIFHGCSHRLG